MSGKRCESCRFFSDFRAMEDEPGEVNGYCMYDFVMGRLDVNPYGGRWTRHDSTCEHWEAEPKP